MASLTCQLFEFFGRPLQAFPVCPHTGKAVYAHAFLTPLNAEGVLYEDACARRAFR